MFAHKIVKSFRKSLLKASFSSSYDLVINGAGPVGASLACALSHSPLFPSQPKILLLDAQPLESLQIFLSKPNSIADQRVVTLTPGSIRFLKSIGIWSKLDLNRVIPFYSMQVWESLNGNHFNLEAEGGKELGRTIEVRHLQAALFERIAELKKCEVSMPNQIETIKKDGFIELELKDGRKINTRLLIGSDGARSKVKQFSKIPTYGWSYNQMGIVCTIEGSVKEERPMAYQRYLTNGPLALLPLWDSYYSIVWTVTLEEFEALMKLSDEKFLGELNFSLTKQSKNQAFSLPFQGGGRSFHYPPLITRICNKRMAFPLNSLQSHRYVSDRIALIGDAAHSVHPMAGQGLNMGLADAMLLANEVIKNLKGGLDIGQENNLFDYERKSKVMNYTMSLTVESIKQGFAVSNGFVSGLRAIALNGINSVGGVQEIIRKGADGDFFLPNEFLWEN